MTLSALAPKVIRARAPGWRRALGQILLLMLLATSSGCNLDTLAGPAAWQPAPVKASDYFSAKEIGRASRYATRHRSLGLAGRALSFTFLALMAFGSLGRRLKNRCAKLAQGLSERPFAHTPLGQRWQALFRRLLGPAPGSLLLFALAFFALQFFVSLPFAMGHELVDQAEGLSNYQLSSWLWDLFKGQLLSIVFFSLLVTGLWGLLRRFPKRWWLLLALPSAGLLLVYGILAPYQARVFNDFKPLNRPALQSRLSALATREGLTISAFKVVDASRTTRALNAYLAGAGPTRELVLFDTLLAKMTPDEIVAVVAHELGHQRYQALKLRNLLVAIALIVGLFGFSRALAWFAAKWLEEGVGDILGLPFLILLFAGLLFVLKPVSAAYSRFEERRADLVGLELVKDPAAVEQMFVKVARENHAELDPPAWAVFLFASHPPVLERLGMAHAARATRVSTPDPAGAADLGGGGGEAEPPEAPAR